MEEVYFEYSRPKNGFFFFFEKLFEKKSKFQEVVVANSSFGKCLILDKVIQFSGDDEFLYHESLVQPAVHLLDSVKNALILGGGDGLAAREFFRHDDIEKVVLVDIDEEVVNASKKYFPEFTQGAFEDSRLEINIQDAFKYVKETKEKFDVVIMDLVDPGHEAAHLFYNSDFFNLCKRVMNKKSIFVTHGSCFSIGLPTAPRVFLDFRKSFKNTELYKSDFINSFDTPMGFMLGSNFDFKLDLEKIEKRYSKIKDKLKYYSPKTHEMMFHKPKWILDLLEKLEPLPKDYVEVFGSDFINSNKIPKKE